jgi:hypothetical protein
MCSLAVPPKAAKKAVNKEKGKKGKGKAAKRKGSGCASTCVCLFVYYTKPSYVCMETCGGGADVLYFDVVI